MTTRFINLFGAPGVGKSTIAAGLYSSLSTRGWEIEMVPEFAKELVWENNSSALTNQAYVTAKQFYMIHRLNGKCRWVVTDSPAFLGAAYINSDYPNCYIDTLKWYHDQTSSGLNFLISRNDDIKYKETGRAHNEIQSDLIENRIETLLERYEIEYTRYDTKSALHHIMRDILELDLEEQNA